MTLALQKALDLLRFTGPILRDRVLPALRAHWKLAAAAALALVAALALRGCAAERARAGAAEAAHAADHARLAAEFEQALNTIRALSRPLAARLDAEQKAGAQPDASFSGSSARQKVPPQDHSDKPAAPAQPSVAPADQAGPSVAASRVDRRSAGGDREPPGAPPCVLHVGDEFEFHLAGVTLHEKDGGHLLLGDVSLDADTGLHLAAVVEAPIVLPPTDAQVTVEVERARWRARAGLVRPWAPSGAYVGGGVRLFSWPWWLEADARATGAEQSVSVGIAREW